MNCGEAKGKHKAGVPQPMFHESSPLASRSVVNLKSVFQAEALGQVNRPLSQED